MGLEKYPYTTSQWENMQTVNIHSEGTKKFYPTGQHSETQFPLEDTLRPHLHWKNTPDLIPFG